MCEPCQAEKVPCVVLEGATHICHKAISGVQDANSAKCDTHYNLMSGVPLGPAPCFCHPLVCSVSLVKGCFSMLSIACRGAIDLQESAVCSSCFGSNGSNFVSRTACLWQFMQQIDYFESTKFMFKCIDWETYITYL